VSLKIMVVDDEPLSLKVMRSLAVPLGHTVLTLDDSQVANQQAETQRFDVVFVGMPQPDGLEFARRIRSSQLNRETTIAMLSPTDDVEMLRQAFGAGVTFVLPKPIVAARVLAILTAMASPQWKVRRHAARLPLITEVNCKWGDQNLSMRSVNISESGMLLQSSDDVKVGQEVLLEFKIAEVRASLNLRARIVRKEGTERVAIEFIDLAPEDQNAIQLYVMGQLKEQTPQRGLQGTQMHRLFRPGS
jgi:CheY-like chemotaxis protein